VKSAKLSKEKVKSELSVKTQSINNARVDLPKILMEVE